MVKIAFIPADKKDRVQYREIDEDSAYTVIKDLVGGWIENVPASEVRMFVDEEGFLKGRPLNVRATLIAGTNMMFNLYGDVVAYGSIEYDANTDRDVYTSITEEDMKRIEQFSLTTEAPKITLRTYVPKAPLW